jgi:hypothetical protein
VLLASRAQPVQQLQVSPVQQLQVLQVRQLQALQVQRVPSVLPGRPGLRASSEPALASARARAIRS